MKTETEKKEIQNKQYYKKTKMMTIEVNTNNSVIIKNINFKNILSDKDYD